MHLFIFWTILILDLALSFIDKMYEIHMGTNCAPFVVDLFLFCYERDFMESLIKEKRYDLMFSIQLLDTCTIYST